MTDRVECTNTDDAASTIPESPGPGASVKQPFVIPTISVPVDVLEATTFFQSVESGATG